MLRCDYCKKDLKKVTSVIAITLTTKVTGTSQKFETMLRFCLDCFLRIAGKNFFNNFKGE